ncbi:MAG: M23 family metallopeptidase [Spirochaetales bacterium]|nr:M23 family metallopeptidase [Spirochaetales bacterium]
MFLYRLFVFSKWAKYIGFLSYILSLFSDHILFSHLTLFVLFVVVEIALNASVFFGSIAIICGMLVIKLRYGNSLPSVETHTSKVTYSLPFEGAWAVVNGGFTQAYSHSWNIPVQRYAYDFVQLHEGRSYTGNERDVERYHCYGKAILSPADGVVMKVNNRSNDSLILGKGRYFNQSNHIAGNYVLVKHAEDQYSLMAHLKKDSILVQVGEKVVRGQQLAQCGNTGNSTEPHLHFHLQNGPHFYTSVGLPIRFSDLALQPCPQYSLMDERPVMPLSSMPEGFISRGYIVQNG